MSNVDWLTEPTAAAKSDYENRIAYEMPDPPPPIELHDAQLVLQWTARFHGIFDKFQCVPKCLLSLHAYHYSIQFIKNKGWWRGRCVSGHFAIDAKSVQLAHAGLGVVNGGCDVCLLECEESE